MWIHEYMPPQMDMCVLVSIHRQEYKSYTHRLDGHIFGYVDVHASMSVSKLCTCLNTKVMSVLGNMWQSECICGLCTFVSKRYTGGSLHRRV